MYLAYGEEAAYLAIFLNDALAIEQTKSMTTRIGSVEDMASKSPRPSLAIISDGYLHIAFSILTCHLSRYPDDSTLLA